VIVGSAEPTHALGGFSCLGASVNSLAMLEHADAFCEASLKRRSVLNSERDHEQIRVLLRGGKAEGRADMKELLGGKGANLA